LEKTWAGLCLENNQEDKRKTQKSPTRQKTDRAK